MRYKVVIGVCAVALVMVLATAFGQNLPSPPFIAIDNQGRPMVGASVTVTDAITGAPAIVYADRAGAAVFSGTVPSNGQLQFYAPADEYRVTIASGGLIRTFDMSLPEASGAIMLSDFGSDYPGFMVKTNASTADLIKYAILLTDPTEADDVSRGYSQLSYWINEVTGDVFVAVDVTAGAAVWKNIASGGGTITAGQNVGAGAGIFKQIVGSTMQFKTITAGDGINVHFGDNAVEIETEDGGGGGDSNVADGISFGNIPVWNGVDEYTPHPLTGGSTSCGFLFPIILGSAISAPNCSAMLNILGEPSTGPYPAVFMGSTDADIATSDVLGSVYFGAFDSSTTPRISGKIVASAPSGWGTNANDSHTAIDFYVQGPGSADELATRALRIYGNSVGDSRVIAGTQSVNITGAGLAKLVAQGIHVKNADNSGFGLYAPSGASNAAYTWPGTSGTSGYVLTTDGDTFAPTLTWEPQSGGDHASTHNPGGGDEVAFYGIIEEEGTPLTARRTVNFTGAGATCSDSGGKTVCNIVGAGSGTGITEINGLVADPQLLVEGTAGTDFSIDSVGDTHTFNIPSASATARGLVTIIAQSFAGAKSFIAQALFPAGLIVNDAGGTGATMVRMEGDSSTNLLVLNATNDVLAVNNNGPFDGATYNAYFVAESTTTREAARFTASQSQAVEIRNIGTGSGLGIFSTFSADGVEVEVETGRAGLFTRNDIGNDPIVEIARPDSTDDNALLHLAIGSSGADVFTVNNGSFDTFLLGSTGQIKALGTEGVSPTTPVYAFIQDDNTGMDIDLEGDLVLAKASTKKIEIRSALTVFSDPVAMSTAGAVDGLTVTGSSTGDGLQIDHTGSARAAYFNRTNTSSTNPVVVIEQNSASNTQPALRVKTSATTGDAFVVRQGASDDLFVVEADGDASILGELTVDSLTGTGKAVCVTSTGELGVCSDAVGISGTCTCS